MTSDLMVIWETELYIRIFMQFKVLITILKFFFA